jgi:hypothetical protein
MSVASASPAASDVLSAIGADRLFPAWFIMARENKKRNMTVLFFTDDVLQNSVGKSNTLSRTNAFEKEKAESGNSD